MDAHSGSMSSWDYLDFELEIRGGGPRKYPVAVRSPAGEAQAEMRFPFDEWELKDRLQALEIALLRSGGTRRRIASPEEHTVQDFGRGLFESLLVGDVRTRYEMSLSEARRQGKGLRLKLRIQPSELAVLPWEFLYDAERDRYPSLSSNTPLVRYLDLPQSVEPLRVSPPLRVLGMVASPLGLVPLDVEHEKRLVEEATRGLREGGFLELAWLEGQTWRHLMRAMRRGPWHVFHFVGHGGFDAATEEGALALSNDVGQMHLLRARGLAELLDDHYPLRLVFLNSCEGARGSESDAFSSTAATLVRRGVPAVVAMQYEITDRAAIEFSRDFYEALADSLPVDAAVTEARAAVSIDSMLEWATPVLYMHSPDGRVFDMLHEGRHKDPTEVIEEAKDQEELLRRYRESVESEWTGAELDRRQAERLRDLAIELGLERSAAASIEREVMRDTIEEILERQEQTAREEERRNHLDGLYDQARRLHRDQEWQDVVDVFAQIHAEDPAYPDPEEYLQSAREALEVARKERDAIRRYREAVEWAWEDEGLNGREVMRLRDLANRFEVSPNTAAQIERKIMGETKEEILSRREQAIAEQYRTAVEEAWTDNELNNAEAKWLSTLANELGLSTDTAADIEREVIGETIPAILQRQRRLDELHTQARQSHEGHEWQMVIDIFDRIHAEDPTFPDPEGLLGSANEALDRMRKVASLYGQGLRYVDGNEWQQALECFEEVQRLEPGYRETEELLSRVHQELAPPLMAKVPDLRGQEVSQASSALTSKGLTLGAQREATSDTVIEGHIIGQSIEAGTEVQPGTSVSVTISSGPSTRGIPDDDQLKRVCDKYTGFGYYVSEAIPRQKLDDARSRIPIPTDERVIALVDNSSMLARGIGLTVCGDGIRWRNYAENPVSKKVQGFLEWSEFADVTLRERQWTAEYGIEMGRDNVFVAWKNSAMDQHRLVDLLMDLQSLVKSSISH